MTRRIPDAAKIWQPRATANFTRDQRAIAAMREITRLEIFIEEIQAQLSRHIRLKDTRRNWRVFIPKVLQRNWATSDLASTRADLQTILQE